MKIQSGFGRRMMKSSIVRAMLGNFLLLTIVAFAVFLAVSLFCMRMAKSQVEKKYGNSIAILSDQMDDFLSDIQVQSGSFLLDMDLLKLSNMKEDFDPYDLAQFQERLALYTKLRFAEVNTMIVLPKQGWVMSSLSGIGKTKEYPLLHTDIESFKERTLWGIQPGIKNPKKTEFAMVLGYTYPEQETPFVVLEIDRDKLLKRMRQYFDSPEVKSFILLDYKGEAYYTNMESPLVRQVAENAAKRLEDQKASEWGETVAFPVNYQGREYTGAFAEVGNVGTKIGVIFDSGEILKPIKKLTTGLLGGLLILAAATSGFAVISYRRFLSPVMMLTEGLRKVKKGDFKVRIMVPEDNDLSLIVQQFNAMVERIDQMIREEYQNKIHLQDAKLRFQKSQINPHFLYNSLFTLYNMIESDELEQAADMAVYLGKYYQQSAHLDAMELPFVEELENIRVYLKIHEMRFPGALIYKEEVEEGLINMRIPILSIQTLVENTLTHGFGRTLKAGNLWIRGFYRLETVCIEVKDDGEGIRQDRIEEIMETLNSKEDILASHGIDNIYQRMREMYPSTRIAIENLLPRGTVIRLEIDKKEVEEGGRKGCSNYF